MTFFRTLMSRMGNIKAGRLIDPETNEDLSDVEATLSGADIALRSADDEFRNFGNVLDEVASKWDSFSNVQQRAVATAFAGTMQQERFLVLMENYGTAMEYMDIAADSAGTASEKYEAYLDSIEAKSQAFQAQFQKLSASIVNSDLVSFAYDAGTGILGFLDAVISKIGVTPVAGGVGGIAAFVKYIQDLQTAMDSLRNIPSINMSSVSEVAATLSGLTKQQQVLFQNMSRLDAAGLKQAQTWAQQVRQGQLWTTQSIMQTVAAAGLNNEQQKSIGTALRKAAVDQDGILITKQKTAAVLAEAVASGQLNQSVMDSILRQNQWGSALKTSTKLTLAQVAANIKLMATNPTTWIALIPVAISLVVQAFDALTTSVEEHIEQLNEAQSAYQETVSELDSLRQALEENQASIDELLKQRSTGDWTLVSQEELDNLAKENAQLQEQIDLLREREKIRYDDYEAELIDRFQSTREGGDARLDRDWSQYESAMSLQSTEIGRTNADLANSGYGDAEIIATRAKGIEVWTDYYQQSVAQAKEAFQTGDTELAKMYMTEFQTAIDEFGFIGSELEKLASNYDPYLDVFERYDNDTAKMPEEIAEIFGDYQAINDAIGDIAHSQELAQRASLQAFVFDSGEFDEEIEKLDQLRQTGQLTEEALNATKFDGLRNALDIMGMSLGEFMVAYDRYMNDLDSGAKALTDNTHRDVISELAELARINQLTADTFKDPAYVEFAQTLTDAGVNVDGFINILQQLGRSASVIVSEDFAKVDDTLRKLVQTGHLTAASFRDNPVFDPLEAQLHKAGVSVEEFIQQLSWLWTTWPTLDFSNTALNDIAADAETAYYRTMLLNTQSQINTLNPESSTYDADLARLTAQLNEYKRQLDLVGQSFDENIVTGIDAATSSMSNLEQAMSDLASGNFENWDAEFIENLVNEVPEAADELLELADGSKEAEETLGDLGRVWGKVKGEELGQALSEAGDTVETYGENSRQAREAIEALGNVLPNLNGLLYDESGQLTAVGQQALLAAAGNKEAAIAMLQAANAAERASMQKLITEYSQLDVEARKAARSVFQLQLAQHAGNIQENDKVIAAWQKANSLPGFSSGGGSSSGGGGGGSGSSAAEEDVLEAYKRDQDILEHRIEMSEAAQNLAEEDTEAWKKEQQNQLNIYLEYADRIKDEMERLRELGYDDDSEEMNQLESDLADVYQNIYEIQKDAWEKARDARIDAIEDELEAAEKAHDAEIEMLEAYINRYEALIGLLKEQHDLSTSIRDERTELNRELSKAQSYVGLTEDERAELFSDADYNQLMGVLDDLQAESIAMYNEYVNQINAVNVEEAYKLDYITAEYQAQYDLMAKKYEIAKQDLALARARIALENAQNNRNVAMLVNGRWTWQADPEAVQSAMDTMYDAENAANNAQMELSYQQQLSQLEIWKAQVELEREAAEAAFEAIREALENEIELLEEQEFIMEDQNMAMGISVENMYGFASGVESAGNALASATSSAVSAVNAAAASAASSISSMMSELSDYSQKTAKDSSYDNRPYDGLRRSSSSSGSSSSGGSNSRGGGSSNRNKVQFFSEGGVMSQTGPAILHGSKSAPEVVFNASDAAKLYDLIHNGDYMQTMFKNLMANLRASMSAVSPAAPVQTPPVQYIVNGLTFGPESSGLTLGELANKLTSAAPFLR